MNRTLVSRLEVGIDGVASAALAAAVGFAFYRWLEPWTPHPQLDTLATLAGSGTLVICWARLSWVDVRPRRFPVAMFDIGATTPSSPPELVLTDAERVDDTLLLDEPLPTVSPDSRVAQLFRPGALKAQIDRHLDCHQDREILESPAPDDSQALYDALAELRRGVNRR